MKTPSSRKFWELAREKAGGLQNRRSGHQLQRVDLVQSLSIDQAHHTTADYTLRPDIVTELLHKRLAAGLMGIARGEEGIEVWGCYRGEKGG